MVFPITADEADDTCFKEIIVIFLKQVFFILQKERNRMNYLTVAFFAFFGGIARY